MDIYFIYLFYTLSSINIYKLIFALGLYYNYLHGIEILKFLQQLNAISDSHQRQNQVYFQIKIQKQS